MDFRVQGKDLLVLQKRTFPTFDNRRERSELATVEVILHILRWKRWEVCLVAYIFSLKYMDSQTLNYQKVTWDMKFFFLTFLSTVSIVRLSIVC